MKLGIEVDADSFSARVALVHFTDCVADDAHRFDHRRRSPNTGVFRPNPLAQDLGYRLRQRQISGG